LILEVTDSMGSPPSHGFKFGDGIEIFLTGTPDKVPSQFGSKKFRDLAPEVCLRDQGAGGWVKGIEDFLEAVIEFTHLVEAPG
jgi:hypothetical protein